MQSKKDWCELTLREKVILFLGVLNKPVERDKLIHALKLLDLLYQCEAQEEQTKSTPPTH